MAFIPIDDPADPRLADYHNVPDPALIERRGIFVAEGRLVVSRLLASPRFATRSVLLTETARRALAGEPGVRDAAPELPMFVVPAPLIEAITGFDIHRGCLAIGERRAVTPWQTLIGQARLLVVAERIANADNVGALFRNAAALGADAVLLDGACTDPLYRKAIRTSMGATLQVPFARIGPWPDALRTLRHAGWTLLALTPAAGPSLPAAVAAAAGSRIALVIGHEGEGLTAAALASCDRHARIPMAPGTDSLNVATAAAIALYELRR